VPFPPAERHSLHCPLLARTRTHYTCVSGTHKTSHPLELPSPPEDAMIGTVASGGNTMGSTLQLVSASTLSPQDLASLINQVYADYYVRVWMDASQVSQMLVEEDVDLPDSVVAMDGSTPVGLSFLSIRGRLGWISGVGTLRAWRRRGVARAILQKLQQTARLHGLQSVWLEVFQQNAPAISLYQGLGFVWERDLLVLTREPDAAPAPSPEACSIRPLPPRVALESFAAFHDSRSPWQRDLASLQHHAAVLSALGCYETRLVGYILYHAQISNCAVYDLAVDPLHPDRRDIAEALLRMVHNRYHLLESYIINVPTADPLLPVFLDLGYDRWQQQYELVWHP